MSETYKLINNDCLIALDELEEASIDSIVTDPPYELNFMGKGWDNSGIAFQKDTWQKCLRVLKPGGYLLAFGGSRTFHRIACAIEDAGFEIRDTIMWLYGSGFPKSMNIGLAIDKKNGVESKVIGKSKSGSTSKAFNLNEQQREAGTGILAGEYDLKEAQNEWNGWGTALKPSFEPIIVARKPFKGSLVDNVIQYGVGGINIDECRVGNEVMINKGMSSLGVMHDDNWQSNKEVVSKVEGRFPANTILTYDETDFNEVCGGFPKDKGYKPHKVYSNIKKYEGYGSITQKNGEIIGYGDSGSASRYFMNCKYTGKDEEIWKQLLVNNVESNLEILKATKDNIVQMNVEVLLKELKDHYVKYVDNQLDLIETPIVQDIVEILTWDFKIGTSQVIQDFIINSKKCIQFLNLVQFVEKMDNIDTTQTTQNLLKLFGYVKVVITNYIQGNIEYDQKRYIYTPKASKKDRDEGLDEIEEKRKVVYGYDLGYMNAGEGMFKDRQTLKKNTHPTVKPTELMQYLVRLVTPKGGTILDPFMGSGSTGKAVMFENKERNAEYKFIGIEKEKEYYEISNARIKWASSKYAYLYDDYDEYNDTDAQKNSVRKRRLW